MKNKPVRVKNMNKEYYIGRPSDLFFSFGTEDASIHYIEPPYNTKANLAENNMCYKFNKLYETSAFKYNVIKY